jgi:ActR/RegA family two-component response regulator
MKARDRILVVDDDVKWLDTIRMILGEDYELNATTQPSEALSLAKAVLFDVAILDQRLSPDLSGVELLSKIRESSPTLRGIILTGYPDVDDAVGSLQSGAVDYISKGRRDLVSQLRTRVAKALTPNLNVMAVSSLMRKGECAELEFKSTARWDMRQNKVNRDLEGVIVKTVCAFLNTEGGGTLLIGVDDAGNAIGLESDYRTLKRQDRDGYENFLTTLLLGAYGKDVSPHLRIDFQEVEGQDVCRISVTVAPRPVFVPDGLGGEHLYIRTGNSTRQLSTREAIDYCRTRWK